MRIALTPHATLRFFCKRELGFVADCKTQRFLGIFKIVLGALLSDLQKLSFKSARRSVPSHKTIVWSLRFWRNVLLETANFQSRRVFSVDCKATLRFVAVANLRVVHFFTKVPPSKQARYAPLVLSNAGWDRQDHTPEGSPPLKHGL